MLIVAALAIGAAIIAGPKLFAPHGGAEAARLVSVEVSFAWPEFHERAKVESEEELEALRALLEGVRVEAAQADLSRALWRVDLSYSDGAAASLAVTAEHRLFLVAGGEALPQALRPSPPHGLSGSLAEWVSPELSEWVRARIEELESRFYGRLLTWPQVRGSFPVGGTAVVRDLETGKSFRVRRHRGDAHADVEPLTAADSRILKEIYGGEWSWKRRAVVITVGGLSVAGSMNGMPHGWGDLFENEFVGHSCIHFWQSRVHGTWREDPGHQLQVLKAAGLLAEGLDAASPAELAMWGVAAINHQDVVSLRYMSGVDGFGAERAAASGRGDGFSHTLSQVALPIRHITHHGARIVEVGERTASVDVSATVYYHHPNPDQGYLKVVTARLERDHPEAPWRVDLASFIPLARPWAPGGVQALSDVPYGVAVNEALTMECGGLEEA